MPKRSSRWGKSCGYALAAVTITPPAIFADAANVAGSDPRLQRHPGFYRSGVLLDGVSYGRRRQRCDPGAGGGPPRRPDHRGDPYRPFADVLYPAVVQADGALAGRVVCNRWSIWCIITKPPTAPSSSSSSRVSCGSSKSIRSGRCAHGAWQPTTGAAGGLQNRAPVRPLFRQRWVNYWPTSRRCCAAPRIARPAPVVVPPVPVANEAPRATIIPAPRRMTPVLIEDLA